MKNMNTKRKTTYDLNIFKDWLRSTDELRSIEEIPDTQLDSLLARFFLSVRSKKGEDYEPGTLRGIQASISRHLLNKKRKNIINDDEFRHSREVLKAKTKELKGKGLGNKKRKADPLTQEEIEMLYQKNLLGTSNPDALLNTVWLNNSLHFGMRSRQEHVDLLLGDVEMKATSSGEQYLEFNERMTKTRKGEAGNLRPFAPKMFAIPGDPRCPVLAFKEYIRRRPESTLSPSDRFYLSINASKTADDDIWYKNQPMGKNKLCEIVKKMAQKAELSGRKVNHSARKTAVSELLHNNVEATTIMQLTGHRNVQSINDYGNASLGQQKNMSNLMSAIGSGNHTVGDPKPSTSNNDFQLSDDDDLANMQLEEVVNTIRDYENVQNVINPQQGTTSTINCAQSTNTKTSRFCILPYATGNNVTINIYGHNGADVLN